MAAKKDATPKHATVAADFDGSGPANVKPATEINASGAPQQIVPDVDMEHPAVDNDPRKGTTINQNKIDFNDPTLSSSEAVEKNLKDQAKK